MTLDEWKSLKVGDTVYASWYEPEPVQLSYSCFAYECSSVSVIKCELQASDILVHSGFGVNNARVCVDPSDPRDLGILHLTKKSAYKKAAEMVDDLIKERQPIIDHLIALKNKLLANV